MTGSNSYNFGAIRDNVTSNLKCFKDPASSYVIQDSYRSWTEERYAKRGDEFDSPAWTVVGGSTGHNWTDPSLTSEYGFHNDNWYSATDHSMVQIEAVFDKPFLVEAILLRKRGDDEELAKEIKITKIKVEYKANGLWLEYGILETGQKTNDKTGKTRKIPIDSPFIADAARVTVSEFVDE